MTKEDKAQYMREWRILNPERIKAIEQRTYLKNRDVNRQRRKVWYAKNKQSIIERVAAYYQTNKRQIQKYLKGYRKKHAERLRINSRENIKRRRKTNISFRIQCNLSRRMHRELSGMVATSRAVELLGCSIDSFKLYLESQFEPEMTWENYGKLWEIDHIMPCAIFDFTKTEHHKRCFHFSNMQPLTKHKNRSKGAKLQFQPTNFVP